MACNANCIYGSVQPAAGSGRNHAPIELVLSGHDVDSRYTLPPIYFSLWYVAVWGSRRAPNRGSGLYRNDIVSRSVHTRRLAHSLNIASLFSIGHSKSIRKKASYQDLPHCERRSVVPRQRS